MFTNISWADFDGKLVGRYTDIPVPWIPHGIVQQKYNVRVLDGATQGIWSLWS